MRRLWRAWRRQQGSSCRGFGTLLKAVRAKLGRSQNSQRGGLVDLNTSGLPKSLRIRFQSLPICPLPTAHFHTSLSVSPLPRAEHTLFLLPDALPPLTCSSFKFSLIGKLQTPPFPLPSASVAPLLGLTPHNCIYKAICEMGILTSFFLPKTVNSERKACVD